MKIGKIESAIIEALEEAGEEELIALYYSAFTDGVTNDYRIRVMAQAIANLVKKNIVSLGLTRRTSAFVEYWAVPEFVEEIVLSWLVVGEDGKSLRLVVNATFFDLRPIVVMSTEQVALRGQTTVALN